MKRPCILFFLFVLGASGCSSKYTTSRPDGQLPPAALERGGSVLVSLPQNGQHEASTYERSGLMTAGAFTTAFAGYTSRVEQAGEVATADANLRRAAASRITYLVDPSIMHWEDRATEWSGRRDSIEIKVVVYEAASRRVVDSATLTGVSKWATMGGDHPQDLLREPVENYVADLFGAKRSEPAAATAASSDR